jgi:uncharacterized protein YwgA
MNEPLKIYEEYLQELILHLAKTRKKIEVIQQRTIALDDESVILLVKLVEDCREIHTSIEDFTFSIKRFKDKLSKEEEA